MPMTKHANMVASRTKISIVAPRSPQNVFVLMIFSENRPPLFGIMRCLFECHGSAVFAPHWLWRRSNNKSLDHEQEQNRAADRDRQVGHPDRERRKIGDGILPG